jgi:hypothetical protein
LRWALAIALCASGCAVSTPPYAECELVEDCTEPADRCYELRFTRSDGSTAMGALCTLECTSDDDCPEGGACVTLEGDATETFFCASRCGTSADCYAGFACTMVEGAAAMQLCLP